MAMKIIPSLLLSAVAWLCVGDLPTAQESSDGNLKAAEAGRLLVRADSLKENRQLDSALVVYQSAVAQAREAGAENDSTVVQCLDGLASCYYKLSEYERCDSPYRQACSIRVVVFGPSSLEVARSLFDVGEVEAVLGRYEESVSLLNQSLELQELHLGPSHIELEPCLRELGNALSMLGRLPEAETALKRAIAIVEQTRGPDDVAVVSNLNYLGNLYVKQSRFVEAEPLFKRAITLVEKQLGRDHPKLSTVRFYLADLYMSQHRDNEAEPLLKQALAVQERTYGPEDDQVAPYLASLAVVYWRQGRFEEAVPHMKRAQRIFESVYGPDHPVVASVLNNLGTILIGQGNLAEAERSFERALEIWSKVAHDVARRITTLHNLAVVYFMQDKYDQAEDLWAQVLAHRTELLGADHPEVGMVRLSLGRLFEEQGRYEDAEREFGQARTIFAEQWGPGSLGVSACLHGLSDVYAATGRYAQAEEFTADALSLESKELRTGHPSLNRGLHLMAVIHGSLGEYESSRANMCELLDARHRFIAHVFSYASEEQKLRYVDQQPLVDEVMLSLALIDGSEETRSAALEMLVKGKGVIIDAMSAENAIISCKPGSELGQTAEQYSFLCKMISTLAMSGRESMVSQQTADRLKTLSQARDSIEAELSLSCLEFKDELDRGNFSLQNVLEALPPGSVYLDYARFRPVDFSKVGSYQQKLGSSRYLAFTLDHDGHSTLHDLGDANQIDSLVRSCRRLIYNAGAELHSPLADVAEERLREVTDRLYERLFLPLVEELGGRESLFVSTDGLLTLLPFEILSCPDRSFLIENYRICYLSSGRDILRFVEGPVLAGEAAVFADPDFDNAGVSAANVAEVTQFGSDSVSGTQWYAARAGDCPAVGFDRLARSRSEAASIVGILRQAGKVRVGEYYGTEALEDVLKSMAAPPRVLHLATHGFFCPMSDTSESLVAGNPLLRCGLAFAGANRAGFPAGDNAPGAEDGILTGLEAAGLDLVGTELVTLAACETGLGELVDGEGVFGLRRAFQRAGAQTIVMSLWKVPDQETAELMDGFYRRWCGGASKLDALRESALDVLNRSRTERGRSHPLLWGGFILAGNPY